MWKNIGKDWKLPVEGHLESAEDLLRGTSWILSSTSEIRRKSLANLRASKEESLMQEIMGFQDKEEEEGHEGSPRRVKHLMGTSGLIDCWKNEREVLEKELRQRTSKLKVRNNPQRSKSQISFETEPPKKEFNQFLDAITRDFMGKLDGFEEVTSKDFAAGDAPKNVFLPMSQVPLQPCDVGGKKDAILKDSLKNILEKVSRPGAVSLVHCLSPIELRAKLHTQLEEVYGSIGDEEIIEQHDFEYKLRALERKVKQNETEDH